MHETEAHISYSKQVVSCSDPEWTSIKQVVLLKNRWFLAIYDNFSSFKQNIANKHHVRCILHRNTGLSKVIVQSRNTPTNCIFY